MERLEDRTKVDVRVTFHGAEIKWQFRRSDMKVWDYETPPTDEQWDTLAEKLRNLYQRGHLFADKHIAQIEKLRNA